MAVLRIGVSKASLADRLRRARSSRRISQDGLAQKLGIKRAAVSQWENPDGTSPSTLNLLQAAVELDVAFEWLATGRGPMQTDVECEQAFSMRCVAQTFEEEDLLAAFRLLNHRHRAALLTMAKGLARD